MPLGPGGKSPSHFQNSVIVGDNAGSVTPILDNRTAVSVSTAGNVTLTAAQFFSGIYLRDCNGAGRTDTTPTAVQLQDFFRGSGGANKGPVVGSTFWLHVRNTSGAANTLTVAGGTGVTISGTATVAQSNCKDFLCVFTAVGASPAVTMYSLGTAVF